MEDDDDYSLSKDGNSGDTYQFVSPGGKRKEFFHGLPWVAIEQLENKVNADPVEDVALIIGSLLRVILESSIIDDDQATTISTRVMNDCSRLKHMIDTQIQAVEQNVNLHRGINSVNQFINAEIGMTATTPEEIEKALTKIHSNHSSKSGRDEALHDKVDQIMSYLRLDGGDTKMMTTDTRPDKNKTATITLYTHKELLPGLEAQIT